MNGTPTRIRGTLSRICFHRDRFLIGRLDDDTTVKGTLLHPQIGLAYTLTGRWERHPRWGTQFAFTDYEAVYPTDQDAVRAYLKEQCRWIGPKISRRLVETYGEDTLRVCKDDPERVATQINGLTLPRAREIAALLRVHERDETVHLALKKLLGGAKVSRQVVSRILATWGSEAPERIQKNPYALIDAVQGIGFVTADAVARTIGYEKTGAPRIRAGLVHALQEAMQAHGHTCLPRAVLRCVTQKLLDVPQERIDDALSRLIEEGVLVAADDEEDDLVYLKKVHADERWIAFKLNVLQRGKPPAPAALDQTGLAADQQQALIQVTTHPVSLVTGSPGTGKTTMIKCLIDSFPEARVVLAAPTGKAAKRLFEQTGRRAVTLHKLLEPQRVGARFVFTRDLNHPIEADLIVLDEVSMIDTALMARFVDAVADHTRLVLVGDPHQLPSVGPGNILRELIASGMIPTAELTQIKRQEDGLIVRACQRIKSGQDPVFANATAGDCFFLERDTEEEIRSTLLELVCERLPASHQADPLRDIQVLTPVREKTTLSCQALNAALQVRLNPNPAVEGCRFKVGDKVIQMKNDYALGVMNGDIGLVDAIDTSAHTLTVTFEAPTRTVEVSWFDNRLELAYALTVHKAQGSEARVVVVPIHKAFGPLILQRNWLYTAVSRARKLCVLVGHRAELSNIVRRDGQQRRYTRLAQWLKKEV